ncbi:MAG TPA: MFS transporter [Microbacteriaceae bacterium]|nr:MFS transporter [Microbacteriaceae bacterium]
MTDSATDAFSNLRRVQNRTVRVLALGQTLGALAYGVTISIGALLAVSVSGDEAFSGLAVAMLTLGAALAAMPLARLANLRGRRWSLGLGNAVALIGIAIVLSAAALGSFPLLLVGYLFVGSGNAGNLQARFAATDLASPDRRARDLSMVVWATTVGAVLGPNLQAPGQLIGDALGMPHLTGAYVFSIVAQVACLLVFVLGLRPDPLLHARELAAERRGTAASAGAGIDRPWLARFAMLAVAASHGVMVAVMSMTPVHLQHEGATLSLIGITISLHVAGMYALSPVFGALADRFGRLTMVLVGQVQLALSLVLIVADPMNPGLGVLALILLGTGWSAATVSGSALLSEASSLDRRTARQGRSDSLMSFTGAASAVAAGGILSVAGYGGLAGVSFVFVGLVVLAAPLAARSRGRGGVRTPE